MRGSQRPTAPGCGPRCKLTPRGNAAGVTPPRPGPGSQRFCTAPNLQRCWQHAGNGGGGGGRDGEALGREGGTSNGYWFLVFALENINTEPHETRQLCLQPSTWEIPHKIQHSKTRKRKAALFPADPNLLILQIYVQRPLRPPKQPRCRSIPARSPRFLV